MAVVAMLLRAGPHLNLPPTCRPPVGGEWDAQLDLVSTTGTTGGTPTAVEREVSGMRSWTW